MRCVTIINQKGGCGKTTTAISLAGVFARRGLRTLLIDMDPQSHCAAGLAIPEQQFDLDIADALLADDPARLDPSRLVWRISRNLDLAPSRMKLAGLEASRGGLADKPDKERRLRRVVEWLSPAYDICCIDCSPSIGILTYNALIAASECLIPVETSYFSLQGATRQAQTIEALQKRLGMSAPVWLLATIHDEASPLAKDLLQELRRLFGDSVAPSVIRQDLRVKEAASFGKPVCDYAPDSPAARDYAALSDWLLQTEPAPAALRQAQDHEPSEGLPVVRAGAARQFIEGAPLRDVQPASAAAVSAVVSLAQMRAQMRAPLPPLPDRSADLASLAARASAPPAPPARATGAATLSPPAPAPIAPAAEPARQTPTETPTEAERIVAANPGASGYGAHSVPGGVIFIQPLSVGSAVAVAGDFGAGHTEHPMRCNERAGIHELRLALPAGSCHYRLIIDGRPSVDPFNRMVEMNPFGAPSSVAFAGPAPAGSEQ